MVHAASSCVTSAEAWFRGVEDLYAVPDRPGLDPRRLDLYMLAMRLSLVAGPLRLFDGDSPDRAFMQGVADHNAKQAPALLPSV
ncbi:hypothetical protein ACFVZJ_19175 [Streptomyces sp. NPDC058322]|uniref:hypothetical protein n=1 Tax=Streptomyces sp. NPDC058322 TaxID=3346446 RepID=UPI0036EF25C2